MTRKLLLRQTHHTEAASMKKAKSQNPLLPLEEFCFSRRTKTSLIKTFLSLPHTIWCLKMIKVHSLSWPSFRQAFKTLLHLQDLVWKWATPNWRTGRSESIEQALAGQKLFDLLNTTIKCFRTITTEQHLMPFMEARTSSEPLMIASLKLILSMSALKILLICRWCSLEVTRRHFSVLKPQNLKIRSQEPSTVAAIRSTTQN